MLKRSLLLLCLCIHLCSVCYGQREDYIWRLASSSGINFNSGNPDTFSTSPSIYLDYCNASICDSTGSLLFYTNGIAIINRNGDTLFNGEGLNPSQFTTIYASTGIPISQADIIIKSPGYSQIYYLFHETYDNNFSLLTNILYLSVVDMTLDGGNGGVTALKNIHWYENDTLFPGKLSAIRHANGRDWWLLAKKNISSIFYKWLVMPDTIFGPIIQVNQPGNGSVPDAGFGQACFSPSGDKYSCIYMNKYFYLYDFDRCTGDLSFVYNKYFGDSSNWGSGCAFSPSGRYLYVATQYIIYQFDIFSGNIDSSRTIVAVYDGYASPSPPFYTHFNLMKLGPNGKIYISTDNGTDILHVIENPDAAGLACNVQQHSFYLSPTIGQTVSVPNIPDYRLGPLKNSGCDTILSINENYQSSISISVFPNPSTGIFKIQCECALEQKEVFNYTGERILFSRSDARDIDLQEFVAGIYFYKITTSDNKIFQGKLVKMH